MLRKAYAENFRSFGQVGVEILRFGFRANLGYPRAADKIIYWNLRDFFVAN